MKIQTIKMWDLSTAHIKQSTADALTEALRTQSGLIWDVLSHTPWFEYGWIIYVGAEESDFDRLAEAGFDDLAAIFRMALKSGISYIKLDCDGFFCEALPTYEW